MSRLPGLDLLRAIAVIWVMLFHSFLVGGLGEDFAWLSRYGWMGVDIFFVLSGFLIGCQVLLPLAGGGSLSYVDFYRRRVFRILPAFATVLALYVAFPSWREIAGMAPWWQFATFTLNLLIDYTNVQAFSHAWSLCVEEHFYLLFPLLAWWMTRRPSARQFAVFCGGLVLAGMALRAGIWWHDSAANPPRNWYIEDLYYPTWCRLDGLLAGVMLAAVAAFRADLWTQWLQRGNAFLLAGLVGMAIALWLFRDRMGLIGNTVGWPILSAALACLVIAGNSVHSLIGRWRIPGAGWVAAVSYSLYLSHKLVFHAVQQNSSEWLLEHRLLSFAVYAAATLLGGAALHYLVERPFLVLRQSRSHAAADVPTWPVRSNAAP